MLVSQFDFTLLPERIAQAPVEPRDHSRLMTVNRTTKEVEHRHFFEIEEYFKPGDLVVWNTSKVFKARLFGVPVLNEEIGGIFPRNSQMFVNRRRVEIFLVRPQENTGVWKVLAKPAKKLRLGMKIIFAEDFWCEVLMKESDGTLLVQFPDKEETVRSKANQYGEVPVPPYVTQRHNTSVFDNYQTVYAKEEGSVAAPTAGFHFTTELIERLKHNGVQFAPVTLHVGLGTFLPVKSERTEDHAMHSEWVELSAQTAEAINHAKKEGRRIIAIGTTTMRVLEGVALYQAQGKEEGRATFSALQPFCGDLNVFITPGFLFRVVDALVTNFHLPKSTLLMLVSAFIGDIEFTLQCYSMAVLKEYRFYSFGDAMFIR